MASKPAIFPYHTSSIFSLLVYTKLSQLSISTHCSPSIFPRSQKWIMTSLSQSKLIIQPGSPSNKRHKALEITWKPSIKHPSKNKCPNDSLLCDKNTGIIDEKKKHSATWLFAFSRDDSFLIASEETATRIVCISCTQPTRPNGKFDPPAHCQCAHTPFSLCSLAAAGHCFRARGFRARFIGHACIQSVTRAMLRTLCSFIIEPLCLWWSARVCISQCDV